MGKTATPTILVTYCDVLTKAYSPNQFGIREVMAPLPSHLDVLAWQLGTQGGSKAYWDPDPTFDNVEYKAGVLPPPQHMWWRGATQFALGIKGCEIAGVPPFQLRRRFKPKGAFSKVRGSGRFITEVRGLVT